jgi:Mrp family chromosome partitioning ATPase
MAELIEDLRRKFRFILLDSPPVLPYADARALAPLVDGVIFVCRAGITTRDVLVRSMELLQRVGSAPVLDVVLNAASYHSPEYGYYYGQASVGR